MQWHEKNVKCWQKTDASEWRAVEAEMRPQPSPCECHALRMFHSYVINWLAPQVIFTDDPSHTMQERTKQYGWSLPTGFFSYA